MNRALSAGQILENGYAGQYIKSMTSSTPSSVPGDIEQVAKENEPSSSLTDWVRKSSRDGKTSTCDILDCRTSLAIEPRTDLYKRGKRESEWAEEEALESEEVRLERLGRQRPQKFNTLWAEIAFCYSIVASQIMAEYFVSGFNVILPTLIRELDIPQASVVWPASAFSLVTAAFLLPFGRLADMYGGYPVYLAGLAWFIVWSLIAGFSKNNLMLVLCRALQGLGPAAFLPAGVMLIGSIYRPGPRKNLIFSLYGGAAPLGFFTGVFFAGLTGSFLQFGWYFWIGTFLTVTTIVPAYLAIPSDIQERKALGVRMDWLGSVLIVSGLILVVFAITDASHAPDGWKTPYIYTLLIVGGLLLGFAFYFECWVAENPLLPFDLFRVPHLTPLFIALFFSYGVLGIFLLYSTLYMQDIMGATPLQVTAWYVPMSAGGVIISVMGGYVLHLLPGTLLMLIAGLGWCLTSLLFALAPEGANYWAYIFPAMIGATVGIDITFNVANIFISTSLSHSRQGLAGALISSLLYLGIAFCLAFADVTQSETAHLGLKRSYQSVFWYQLACAVLALVILLAFVRIKEAKSELTVDERAALESEMK
ncbi:MAG: hypothetical protein Q9217_005273 [Psora testacea]